MLAFVNEEELERSIEKIQLYKNSANIKFDEMMKSLEKLNLEFDTGNRKHFQNLQHEFDVKGNMVNKLHNNNIYVLEKTLSNYRETALKNAKSLKNIQGGDEFNG